MAIPWEAVKSLLDRTRHTAREGSVLVGLTSDIVDAPERVAIERALDRLLAEWWLHVEGAHLVVLLSDTAKGRAEEVGLTLRRVLEASSINNSVVAFGVAELGEQRTAQAGEQTELVEAGRLAESRAHQARTKEPN